MVPFLDDGGISAFVEEEEWNFIQLEGFGQTSQGIEMGQMNLDLPFGIELFQLFKGNFSRFLLKQGVDAGKPIQENDFLEMAMGGDPLIVEMRVQPDLAEFLREHIHGGEMVFINPFEAFFEFQTVLLGQVQGFHNSPQRLLQAQKTGLDC